MENIAEVIKYEGDNSTFIWKHPCEDFNTMTQLIVHESQEAIFFLNGEALDLFGPGRHTLETQNIPKLGRFFNRTIGGETPFHCEVYFINKTVQMAIKWGTDSKVRYIDPHMGIPLEIGACGEMNLAVSDSRKLLLKLVGTMRGIAWGENGVGFTKSIQNAFRPLISTAVKTHLSSAIKTNGINILEIDENLELLSEVLRRSIVGGFEEYGLTIPQFYLTNVALPESDPNFKRMKELHTISFQTRMIQAETLVKSAQADAEAEVAAARRKAELERQITATEIAKREAERDLIRAQVEAQSTKMAGLAEADIMRAKGYSQKDVLQAQVQMAYAEGLSNMNIGGSTGGSAAGDMLGLGIGMAAASAVVPQISEMFKGMAPNMNPQSATAPTAPTQAPVTPVQVIVTPPQAAVPAQVSGEKTVVETPTTSADLAVEPAKESIETLDDAIESFVEVSDNSNNVAEVTEESVPAEDSPEEPAPAIEVSADEPKCAKCGATLPANAKFCLECGEKVAPAMPDGMVVCAQCGSIVVKGKFCPECGFRLITNCPKCGTAIAAGAKFCLECGEKL